MNKLIVGTVVKKDDGSDVKYILKRGWYNYNDSLHNGMYLLNIETHEVTGINHHDLYHLIPVNDTDRYHTHHHDCPHPLPHDDYSKDPFDFRKRLQSFTVVKDIEERDKIPLNGLFDGRIVRVNDVDGRPANYSWDAQNNVWIEVNLDGDCKIPWTYF